jgi:hypothetical protein
LPPQWRQPQAGQYPPSPQPYPPPNPQAPYGSQPPVYGSQAQPGFPYQRRNPGGLATQQPGTGTGSQPAGPGNVPDLIRQILTNPRQQGGFGQPGGRQIGAGIAGVATTLEAEGVKIYNERTKYDEWEFVYDPQKDMRSALGGPAIGQPQQQQGTGEQSQKPAPAFTSPGFGSRKR